jgi:hypothetical protein
MILASTIFILVSLKYNGVVLEGLKKKKKKKKKPPSASATACGYYLDLIKMLPFYSWLPEFFRSFIEGIISSICNSILGYFI